MSGGPEGFILAFGLMFSGGNHPDLDQRNKYQDAARQAAEAGYVDSGLKSMIDTSLKDMERRYVPKEVIKYGSPTVIILRTITEKRFVFTYEF